MRVGIFFPGFPAQSGGGHTFEQELLSALDQLVAESNHSFTLFVGENTKESDLNSIASNRNLKVLPLPKPNLYRKLRLFAPKALKRIAGWDVAFDLINPLQQAVVKERIELIFFPTPVYLAVDIPYIATVWDIQHRLQPWFPEVSQGETWDQREAYYSTYLQRAAFILTPSKVGRDELSFLYDIPERRFRLLPHPNPHLVQVPKDEAVLSVQEKYNISSKYLFYPAQFWPHKNHANLIKALKILRDRENLDLELVLVGSDQGNLEHIKELAGNLHLEDCIHFLNFVPREDLINLYLSAFALTYLTYFGPENFPPLEAFACQCPVIASDILGALEQLGDAALLVDPSKPEEIALAVLKIYNDSQLRTKMINKGFVRSERFNSLDYIRGVFEILDEFEAVRINWK